MQDHDWNDLKYVLALHRTGRLSLAGNATDVSETTVARRIKALEAKLGVVLFVRGELGIFEATDAGLQAVERAEIVEQENHVLREAVGRLTTGPTGVVRISSVPVIVNRILVPRLGSLRELHPGLTVELVPESRNLDLSKREADLAIRFSRPNTGGLQTKARKIGELRFAVFGPANVSLNELDRLPWIGYDDTHRSLPQAKWLRAVSDRLAPSLDILRVADLETALEAVVGGLGRTILPDIVGRADARLKILPLAGHPAPPVREVWLLSHADQTARASVGAAKEWLSDLDWEAA